MASLNFSTTKKGIARVLGPTSDSAVPAYLSTNLSVSIEIGIEMAF